MEIDLRHGNFGSKFSFSNRKREGNDEEESASVIQFEKQQCEGISKGKETVKERKHNSTVEAYTVKKSNCHG